MFKGILSIFAIVLLGVVATMAPMPAIAQGTGTITPPPGCTAFLTVQSRSCVVSHMWTCEGDPEGSWWRLSMDGEGPFSLSHTDSEFRWLTSYGLRNGSQAVLVEPEEDPASITELFETGSDSMVFTTIYENAGGQRIERNYTGFDRLTGETVEIDGRILNRTRFSYEYNLGDGPRRVEGTQYVHEGWRMFFGGVETTEMPGGESFESDNSPMDFAEPGERGFLRDQPLYDCGDMMS